jgi:hypothetical protein
VLFGQALVVIRSYMALSCPLAIPSLQTHPSGSTVGLPPLLTGDLTEVLRPSDIHRIAMLPLQDKYSSVWLT